jgi:S1/P1 Nuclease
MRGWLSIGTLLVCLVASPACAWWDEAHMQIAYVAYQHLDPSVKQKVDDLLKLNSDYGKWTANAPDDATAKVYAFVHAATWADDIKTKPYGYTRDSVTSPTAGQNIGYSDHNQHAYWHFKDILFSPDGTPLPPPGPVDAVTQAKLMIAALPASSGSTDDVRSYDLVWLIHLVGDLHQPLHAISRYTLQIPNGDAGGNTESVIPSTGEAVALHGYWDGVFGGYSSPYGAVFDATAAGGLASLSTNPIAAAVTDPEAWAEESAEIAKTFAYASPVSTGTNPVMLTRDYETNARNVACSRAALAAARLANVLNAALR